MITLGNIALFLFILGCAYILLPVAVYVNVKNFHKARFDAIREAQNSSIDTLKALTNIADNIKQKGEKHNG